MGLQTGLPDLPPHRPHQRPHAHGEEMHVVPAFHQGVRDLDKEGVVLRRGEIGHHPHDMFPAGQTIARAHLFRVAVAFHRVHRDSFRNHAKQGGVGPFLFQGELRHGLAVGDNAIDPLIRPALLPEEAASLPRGQLPATRDHHRDSGLPGRAGGRIIQSGQKGVQDIRPVRAKGAPQPGSRTKIAAAAQVQLAHVGAQPPGIPSQHACPPRANDRHFVVANQLPHEFQELSLGATGAQGWNDVADSSHNDDSRSSSIHSAA